MISRARLLIQRDYQHMKETPSWVCCTCFIVCGEGWTLCLLFSALSWWLSGRKGLWPIKITITIWPNLE